MKNALLVLTTVLALSACATSKQTYMPDGRSGYTIDCSGQALSWGGCFQKAGELCGSKGYDTLAQAGDEGSTMAANQYGLYGGAVITRSMVVACKP
jgi:hypothetical protein